MGENRGPLTLVFDNQVVVHPLDDHHGHIHRDPGRVRVNTWLVLLLDKPKDTKDIYVYVNIAIFLSHLFRIVAVHLLGRSQSKYVI